MQKQGQLAWSEELKHSVSTVAAHKNPVDAGIVFDGWPSRNRFLFPEASIGSLRAEIPKRILFHFETFPGLPSGRISIWWPD